MKICLVSPLPLPMGGIATWTESYVTSDIAKKHEIVVIDTSIIGKRKKNVQNFNLFEEIKRNFNILKKFNKVVSEGQYQLFHINTACSLLGMLRDIYMISILNKKKIKVITHFHCDTKYMVKGRIKSILFKKICKSSSELFCLNKNSKDHINKVCSTNTILFPNFIKLKNKNYLKAELNKKIKKVIFAGHVVKTKGILEILEIAKRKPEIEFTIVGAFSDIKIVEEAKNLKNVLFLGEKSKQEVLHLMRKNDLFLFPSHNEGFPNVILEAMSEKLPIIATRVGAIPDILDNEKSCLVDVGDIEKIIELMNVLEDYELRLKITSKNYIKIHEKYEMNNVIERIFERYDLIKNI